MGLMHIKNLKNLINKELTSKETIDNLFMKLEKVNDKTASDKIKMEIIEHCEKLTDWWINYFFSDYEFKKEEIYINMLEVLICTIAKYDYRKKENFYLIYSNNIYNKFIRYFEQLNDISTEDTKVDIDIEFEDIEVDIENKVYDKIEDEQDIQVLYAAINALDEKDKYIFNSILGLNGHELKTQAQIAHECGVSRAHTNKKYHDIIESIKIFYSDFWYMKGAENKILISRDSLSFQKIYEKKYCVKSNEFSEIYYLLDELLSLEMSNNDLLEQVRQMGYVLDMKRLLEYKNTLIGIIHIINTNRRKHFDNIDKKYNRIMRDAEIFYDIKVPREFIKSKFKR